MWHYKPLHSDNLPLDGQREIRHSLFYLHHWLANETKITCRNVALFERSLAFTREEPNYRQVLSVARDPNIRTLLFFLLFLKSGTGSIMHYICQKRCLLSCVVRGFTTQSNLTHRNVRPGLGQVHKDNLMMLKVFSLHIQTRMTVRPSFPLAHP